jgi:DNA-binding LytR/AlgR family response regulator
LANVGYPAAVLEMGTVLAKLSELLFVEALRRYVEVVTSRGAIGQFMLLSDRPAAAVATKAL